MALIKGCNINIILDEAWRGVGYFIAVAALVLLIVLAVVSYVEYGRGLGYFMIILLPIPYIIAGLIGVITRFWWIATAAINICAFLVIIGELNSILVMAAIILTTVSIMIGLCGGVFRRKLNPRSDDPRNRE